MSPAQIRIAFSAALVAVAAIGGCSQKLESRADLNRAPLAEVAPKLAQDAGPRRYVAVRNFLAIEVDAEAVQQTLDDVVGRCKPPECELIESAVSRSSRHSPPAARLRVRVVPARASAFLDELAKRGDLIERRTESEDKTDQVIDVDARLKNTAELRDRLRKLLASPNLAVKDAIEIETQLARVQGDLESAQGQRLSLANETDKVAITAEIRSRRTLAEANTWSVLGEAFRSAGHTLAASLAGLVTFIVAVFPWLLLLVPVVWAWRKWRARRRTTS